MVRYCSMVSMPPAVMRIPSLLNFSMDAPKSIVSKVPMAVLLKRKDSTDAQP